MQQRIRPVYRGIRQSLCQLKFRFQLYGMTIFKSFIGKIDDTVRNTRNQISFRQMFIYIIPYSTAIFSIG